MSRWLGVAGLLIALACAVEARRDEGEVRAKAVTVDGATRFQRIDGFGVNVTPAQWRNGNLARALDVLVDDLGTTLVRFDAYGKADWLDPARRRDGRFDPAHLREVYTRQDFRDAWATFRYLAQKGARPFWSVSGRIPAAWAGADGQTLVDYDAYADMVASQLAWARREEHLEFSLLSPFNETDLGFPEGPRLPPAAIVPATRAIVRALDREGLADVKLIVADDSSVSVGYLDALLTAPDLAPRVAALGTHWYGDGNEGDGERWYEERRPFAIAAGKIAGTPAWAGRPLWITEYGDLDQSEEVEYGVAWRSTRRLLKLLADGASAAMAWDAYDNFHEHDAAWATYGLLRTDRSAWTYTPKPRYYAARQVYRYVRPGMVRVSTVDAGRQSDDVFDRWTAPLRHVRLEAFASPDGRELTLVGMSAVERASALVVTLSHLAIADGTALSHVRTSGSEQAAVVGTLRVQDGRVTIPLATGAIFTVTTRQP